MKRGQVREGALAPRRRASELARMARPVTGAVSGILRFYHFPLALLTILYLASGLTSVAPDEVALKLRFGRLVGGSPAAQVHPPGFLFALPAPIEEVVRVNVKKVRTLRVLDLTYGLDGGNTAPTFARRDTLDPEADGYCLTGDRGVLHALLAVGFRVTDPVAWALEFDEPEEVLRAAVLSAMLEAIGRTPIDDVLGEGRAQLSRAVLAAAQDEADARGLGVELALLEFEELLPPAQVQPAFRNVVSTAIDAYTKFQEAEQYRGTELPAARADAQTEIAAAQAEAAERVARARGEVDAFRSLLVEYHARPELVHERLLRETLERALEGARVRAVPPPPEGERYGDFRITLPF